MFILGFLSLIVGIAGQFRSPEITEHPADLLVPRNEPATLYCHAEGRPQPTISWFKNGKQFKISSEGGRHVLLDNGDLFFLRVLQTKKEDDSGLYWCQASNSVGTVRSKNATLEIAVLKEEFKEVPEDTQVAEGESALLSCTPPRGHPDPVVVWTKDKKEIDLATQHRYKLVNLGSLTIKGVRVSDSGKYTCKARNVYATRETKPAFLTVLVPPHLVSSTGEVTGAAGGTLELVCRVGGDPPPEVFWERVPPGVLPVERMTQEEGGQVLRIRHVAREDQGIYTCRAENPVGAVKANISLIVHSRPVILKVPNDAKVGMNGTATFECETSGNPSPMTYWTLEGKGVILESGQTSEDGRISVDSYNVLIIRGIVKEDQGYYICTAVGIAGSAIARAHLEVQGISDLPPPIIALGAPNQTLPIGTEGDMPCVATGSPEPKVEWFTVDKPFRPSNRSSVTPLGTLRIVNLRASDTGTYTCKATSSAGTSEWTTSLIVANPTNPNVAFFKMPNEGALPEPPGYATVEAINMTTVTLGWRRGRAGSSPVLGYTVQLWSPDVRGPWMTANIRAAPSLMMPVSYIATGLMPETRYVFIVRASNSHGLSRPSTMTHMIRTLSSFPEGDLALHQIRTRLSESSLRLLRVEPVSPSSLKVNWHLRIDASIIEGLYIRYRSLDSNKKFISGALSVETVYFHKALNGIPDSHSVTGLRPGTAYELFAVPFYRNIEGKPSASLRSTTPEAPAAMPPTGLHYTVINGTTIRLTWDPLPQMGVDGRIRGYNIQVIEVSPGRSIAVNKTVTATWSTVGPLEPGYSYHATVRAVTTSGGGPASPHITFSMPSASGASNPSIPSSNVESNNYLIVVIACSALVLFGSLFVSVFLIYRRRQNNKCPSYIGKAEEKTRWSEYPRYWDDTGKSFGLSGTLHTEVLSQRASMTQFYHQPSSDGPGKDEYEDKNICFEQRTADDLYEDPDGLRLVCFTERSEKGRCLSPAPYATTTLITDEHLKLSSDLLNRLPPNIPIEEMRMAQTGEERIGLDSLPPMEGSTNASEYSYNFNTNFIKDLSPMQIVQFPECVPISSEDKSLKHASLSTFNPDFGAYLLKQEDSYSYTCPSKTGSFRSQGSTFGHPALFKNILKNPSPHHSNSSNKPLSLASNSADSLEEPDKDRLSQIQRHQKLVRDLNNFCWKVPQVAQQTNNPKDDTTTKNTFPSRGIGSCRMSPRSSTFGDSEGSEVDDYSTSSCSSRRPVAFQHSDDSYQAGVETDWGEANSESLNGGSPFTTAGLSDADTDNCSSIHSSHKKHLRTLERNGPLLNSLNKNMSSPLI